MNKYWKNGLFSCLLLLSFNWTYAQYKSINLIEETWNSGDSENVIGRFFNTDSITNTAAVSTTYGEILYKTFSPNLYNTLSGQLTGLMSLSGNGATDNDGAQLAIRGIGSYGLGGINSLKIFVDGFEVQREYLSFLSPAEIGSVSVLKDAAALSTFGMNGANGILWIETDRGRIGDFKTTVRVRSGFQQPLNIYKPLNALQYSHFYNIASGNDAGEWAPAYSPGELELYKMGLAPDVDWYGEVFTNNSFIGDADLKFNGGSENSRYNIVLGYLNQEGLYNIKNTDSTSNQRIQRFSLRGNLDFNLFKVVEARVDIGGRIESRKQPNYGSMDSYLRDYPSNIYPVYDTLIKDDSKNFSGTSIYPNNPVGQLKGRGWLSSTLRTLQTNIRLKERLDDITEGLYLQEEFSFYVRSVGTYNKTGNYARYFKGEATTNDESTKNTASSFNAAGMDQRLQGSIGAGFDKQINKHQIRSNVNLLMTESLGDGYFKYNVRDMNLSGRFNYSYNNRYVGELGFSYFGSDSYAPGNRWGFFPTLSGSWIISNEKFYKNIENTIDFAKVRASVGLSGEKSTNATSAISFNSGGRFLYKQYYGNLGSYYTGTTAPFSGHVANGPLFLANPNIFSEKSLKYNLGIDLSILTKIKLTADLFMDKRHDIITQDNAIMGYYGRNNYLDNVGKMTNKGFETSISFTDKVRNQLRYSVYGMISYARNRINYMAEVVPKHPYNGATGKAYGSLIGLNAIGFYDVGDFDSEGKLKEDLPKPAFGDVNPGDIKYEDLDNDGFVDENDYTKVGNPSYPTLLYSFGAQITYKGFDLGALFQGAGGADINLLNYAQFIGYVDNANAYNNVFDAWAYYPNQGIDTRENALFPKLSHASNDNNYRTSSLWMRNNDYLRLKNIELGYEFTDQLIRAKGIYNLRLFLNAYNLFTISKLLDKYQMDPESGFGYPSVRSFSAGISFTF